MSARKLVAALFATALLAPPSLASAAPRLPGSIAAIGDSVTRAVDACCWYGDHPAQSWSTGDGTYDGISSHYERILALKPAISGHNYNHARSGAKMRDAEGQAEAAVTSGARYVTILMGANDVCTSSRWAMTAVTNFRAQFAATMSTLAAGLPSGKHVFVGSIPNVYHLWQTFAGDATAQLVWAAAGICQSMLSPYNTETDRQAVLTREKAFNRILADVCSRYVFCRFDDYAVFNYRFTASQVSKLDYFHPNLAGEKALANVTWQHSWWGPL